MGPTIFAALSAAMIQDLIKLFVPTHVIDPLDLRTFEDIKTPF